MDKNIVHVSVTYQVQFESTGRKGEFPAGTWYQGFGFIGQNHPSIEDANYAIDQAMNTVFKDRAKPQHRIVQTTSVMVVIE